MKRIGFIVLLLSAVALHAQERGMFSRELAAQQKRDEAAGARHNQTKQADCRGPIALVTDVGFEGLKTTSANYGASPGGGEGGRFDKTPVLSTRVELREGCLNAHFSALVGSKQTYGDIVVTPLVGTGVVVLEDMVDKYVLDHWLEQRFTNRLMIKMTRSLLTPSTSFGNILRGRAPWRRDYRAN